MWLRKRKALAKIFYEVKLLKALMAERFSRLRKFHAEARALWDESALRSHGQLSKVQKFAHFWVLVWKSFTRNRCPVRATALAYASLLALIPMLAVVMSVTSSFLKKEGEDRIDQFIVQLVATMTPAAELSTNAPGEESNAPGFSDAADAATNSPADYSSRLAGAAGEVKSKEPALPSFAREKDAVATRKAIARNIHQFIQNTRSGTLGVTGSVLLIFAAISMLTRVEDTFNDIWGVARGRSWFMRIVLYWGVISLAPLFVVVALGLSTGPHLQATKQLITTMPFVGNLVFELLPVLLLCLTFGAFYMLMPNTKVDWRAALVGGLIGGFLFHLNNVLSVFYVSRVVSYSKIYGSIGLVPVFMIGLYFAWLILLLGAQIAYAFQNRTIYLEEKQVENINQRGREFIALRLMTWIAERFLRGELPVGIPDMARQLCVPTRLIQQTMQTLAAARLVVETAGLEPSYLPARPLEQITCHDILLAMRAMQGQELATRDEPTRSEVFGEFNRIEQAERQAASSVTLLALACRTQERKQISG